MEIPDALLREVLTLGTEAAPREACGLIAGDGVKAASLHPAANVAAAGDRFEIATEEQFDLLRRIEALGERPMAVFHSHPTGVAYPSALDVELADRSLLQVIASVPDREVRTYRIGRGEVTEVLAAALSELPV